MYAVYTGNVYFKFFSKVLYKAFYPNESVCNGVEINKIESEQARIDLTELCREAVKDGVSIVARDVKSKQIVGIAINKVQVSIKQYLLVILMIIGHLLIQGNLCFSKLFINCLCMIKCLFPKIEANRRFLEIFHHEITRNNSNTMVRTSLKY